MNGQPILITGTLEKSLFQKICHSSFTLPRPPPPPVCSLMASLIELHLANQLIPPE